jgi:FixJ family two-component response regulator
MQPIIIAVVEDDASVLSATQALLRSRGFSTLGYESAEAFMNSSDGRQASCLVLDLQLPGLSGVQLHEALRAQGVHIPAILVTGGYARGEELRSQPLPAGVVAVLDKPFDGDTLIRWVGLAVGHR